MHTSLHLENSAKEFTKRKCKWTFVGENTGAPFCFLHPHYYSPAAITEGRCPVSARRQGMQAGTQSGGHTEMRPHRRAEARGCRASGAGLQARHLCPRALLPLLCPVRLQVTGLGEGSHSSPHSGCPQAQWGLPHVPTKSGAMVPASSWTAWSAMSPRVPSVDPPPTAWREGNHPSYPHALKS